MVRRIGILLLISVAGGVPAHAQLAVIDPANLTQTALIAQRAQQHLDELRAQHQVILRMARALPNIDRYRLPAIGIPHHNASRFEYGRPLLAALNSGDANGAGYLATALPLQRPHDGLARLSASARRGFERQYATIEIADSVAMMASHQVGALRGYHGQFQRAIQSLEDDVMNGFPRFHEITTVLDKVAAGELLGRRQDMAANQLLSHALEQLLSRSKRMRDTEASAINMQLVTWRDGASANAAFVEGTGDALRRWRQP